MDNILAMFLKTPQEILLEIAKQAKERRLELNISQEGLARRSGISLGSLKRFERTGQISLESLLKLALVLGVLSKFEDLFKDVKNEQLLTLNSLLQKENLRKKGTLK